MHSNNKPMTSNAQIAKTKNIKLESIQINNPPKVPEVME